MPIQQKIKILRQKHEALKPVLDYINVELNPAKCNIYEPMRDVSVAPLTIEEILHNLGLSKETYGYGLFVYLMITTLKLTLHVNQTHVLLIIIFKLVY